MEPLTQNTRAVLQGHTDWVSSVAITSDSKYIIPSGSDSTARIWNLQDKRQDAVLQFHTKYVYCVAITNDNKYIICGGDKTLTIWNL